MRPEENITPLLRAIEVDSVLPADPVASSSACPWILAPPSYSNNSESLDLSMQAGHRGSALIRGIPLVAVCVNAATAGEMNRSPLNRLRAADT